MKPSGLILGTAQWGMPYGIANQSGVPSTAEVEAILSIGIQHGVTVLDTARAYGESEARIGTQKLSSRFRIITKLSPRLDAVSTDPRVALEASLKESSKALGHAVIDTVLFHRGTHALMGGGELWKLLKAIKAVGRVRRVGVSAVTPDEAWECLALPGLDCIQVASSLLDRRLYDKGFFEQAHDRGIEVFVRSTYLQGVAHLSVADLPLPVRELAPVLSELDRIARENNLERWQIFLAWMKHRVKGTPVLGVESAVQLKLNLETWGLDIDVDVLSRCEMLTQYTSNGPVDPSRWR